MIDLASYSQRIFCLACGNFVLGQPVPKDFAGRTALAYTAGTFMLVAGAAVEWRRIEARVPRRSRPATRSIVVIVFADGPEAS
jgi:hypothetical protein